MIRCTVLAFPPLQGFTDPGFAWARRLARLINVHSMLTSANAYVSTLGGGHFLCRHIGPALALARLQMEVSRRMSDVHMEARCWIHVAYSLVQAGRFRSALRVIKWVAAAAAGPLQDDTLSVMCTAAERYCRRAHKLYASGELRRSEPDSKEAAVRDDFYRQRLVQMRDGLGRWLGIENEGGSYSASRQWRSASPAAAARTAAARAAAAAPMRATQGLSGADGLQLHFQLAGLKGLPTAAGSSSMEV